MDGRGRALSGTGAERAEVLAPGPLGQTQERFPVHRPPTAASDDAQVGDAHPTTAGVYKELIRFLTESMGSRPRADILAPDPPATPSKTQ